MAKIKVKIRGRTIEFDAGTSKADIARTLLSDNAANYTVSEVSKAIPAAYSQVLTISKKMVPEGKAKPSAAAQRGHKAHPQADDLVSGAKQQVLTGGEPPAMQRAKQVGSSWGQTAKAPGKKSMKPVTSPVLDAIKKGKPVDLGRLTGRVGKLRTPGLPSDTAIGECANCGFELVIRNGKDGLMLTHIGMSTEEYLSMIQFCQAVPKILLA